MMLPLHAGIGLGIAIKYASVLNFRVQTNERQGLVVFCDRREAWSRKGLLCSHRYLEEGDNVVLVGRSLERLHSALPKDFKPKGTPHFVAKDVSTVLAASVCSRR